MAAPAQANTLRASDFPSGLTDKASMERLFQFLNPFLAQVQTVTTSGTSMKQNIDGQFATFTVVAKAVAATPQFDPLLVRLKDGKKPFVVFAWARNNTTQQVESTWMPAWTYKGQSDTVGNQLSIDNVPGLTPGVTYTVNLFIFF